MASPAPLSLGSLLVGPCRNCGYSTLDVARVLRDLTAMYVTVYFSCRRCGCCEVRQVSDQLFAQFAGPLWTPEPESEPKEPEVVPVIHGSVIGYRAWRIQNWQLYGTGVNRAWVPGVNEATCDAGDDMRNPTFRIAYGSEIGRHPAPAIGCHCGITCLARFIEGDTHWADADVFGAIEAWSDELVDVAAPGDVADATGVHPKPDHDEGGRFILHGNGFRAQYGKVVLLAVDDDWPMAKKAAVRALAREHEADVCKHAHLEDAAKEHGQLVPDEMLKWAAEADPVREVAGSYLGGAMMTLAGQMQVSLQSLQSFGLSVNNVCSAYGSAYGYSSLSSAVAGGLPRPPRPRGRRQPKKQQGICQTLGHPGPPQGRITLYRKGQRVRDSKGEVWLCVKAGKPGSWESEDSG